MDKNERERLCIAYMDGEMSTSEASAFHDSLAPEERDWLTQEVQFEAKLAEALTGEEQCPDLLWERTRRMMTDEAEPAGAGRMLTAWRVAGLAAAAMLVAGISFLVQFAVPLQQPAETPAMDGHGAILGPMADNVQDFSQTSATSDRHEAVQRFLHEHGIDLELASIEDMASGGRHVVRLLGACMGNCPRGELIEVLFECDGYPAKVVVGARGSAGASLIQKAVDRGEVQATRAIGDYVAAVVCDRPAEGLLQLLRQESPQII